MPGKFLSQARVLICDDEEPIRKMLDKMLQFYGCTDIILTSNGQEAVERVSQVKPDVIIMDINLSSTFDGIDAALSIKKIIDIPLVYVTGNMNDTNFSRIRETRPAGMIEKPFNDRMLIYTLEIALYNYQSLIKAEFRYKKITEAITDYIYTVNLLDNKPLETIHGPMCENITGYTAEEFRKDPFLWYKIIYEKDIKRVSFHFNHLIENRYHNPLEIEHRLVKKDGSIRWVRNSTVFHYNSSGEAVSYDGVVRDITDRKDLEETIFEKNNELLLFNKQLKEMIDEKTKELEMAYANLKQDNIVQKDISIALRESRKRFYDLANFLPEITFELDKNGVVTFVNENGIKKLGYERSDIENFNALNILDNVDREKAALNMLKLFSGEEVGANSYTIVKKDGTTFPALFHSQKYIGEDGEPLIRGIIVDITSQKTIEDQLRQSQEALKERIALTDLELSEAHRIHQMLLPQGIPDNDLVIASYRYEPYVMVGGDYFSFSRLKELDGLGIFIGDVSGHGVSAALFTSLIKTNTDFVCREFGTQPAKYLCKLNSILYQNLNDHFITGVYGFFNRDESGQVFFTFGNAGHPEVIVYRKKLRSIEKHNPKGKLLGVSDNCVFEESSIKLDSGDRVFLYTDGLIETTDDSLTMIEESVFYEIVERNNLKENIDEVLEQVMMDISLFRDKADIVDDMLIVGFEVL